MPTERATDALGREVDRACSLIDLRRYAEAEPVLRRLLAADPEHVDGLNQLARLLYCDDRLDEAAVVAGLLIARRPNAARGHRRLAWVRYAQNRTAEAESHARRAIALAPDAVDSWVLLGNVLTLLPGRVDEALAAADEAIRLDAHSSDGYEVRGIAHSRMYRWPAAEAALADALARAPHSPDIQARMALVKLWLGHVEEARDLLMTCLRLDPSPRTIRRVIRDIETNAIVEQLADVYALVCAAVGHPRLGVPGSAGSDGELLTQQARLVREMWQAAATYGHAWPQATRERARALVTAILAADPTHCAGREAAMVIADEDGDHVTARGLAAGLLADGYDAESRTHCIAIDADVELERPHEALDRAEAAVSRHPHDIELACRHWRVLLLLGRQTEAVAVAAHATRLAAEDHRHPLIELARIQAESGCQAEAMRSLDVVLALTSGASLGRLQRAGLLIRAYDFVGAEKELTSGDPPLTDGVTHALLAHSRIVQGKWTQALADYESALVAPIHTSKMPRLIRDMIRSAGIPDLFRNVYVDALARLGEEEAPDVPTKVRGERLYGMVGFLMLTVAQGEAEALRWARVCEAEARALDPDHEAASTFAAIVANPESADARGAVAAIRARLYPTRT